MEQIIILFVDMKDVLQLIGNVVILWNFIEVLLETPKDLTNHSGSSKIIKP